MKKSVFISRLIYTMFILIFLLSITIRTEDIKTKIMLIPFVICGFSSTGKNICLILDKGKLANIFSKVFIISLLLFWFGFLAYWSYLCIRAKNYLTILFIIPFFIIGIYLIRKFLLNKTTKKSHKAKNIKFNYKIIIASLLVLAVLLSGIVILFLGIKDTYKLSKITKGYVTTEGYFLDYEIYNIDKKDGSITYKLIYNYKVNGKEYTVSTDFGVGNIPEYGSIREVKYNPENPSESVLVGTNNSSGLIFFGAFFTLGGFVFVLIALQVLGVFDKVKVDIIGIYVGAVFLIIGIGIILFQIGLVSSFIEMIKAMGFWILIPLLFIVVGMFQIIKCLFLAKRNINGNNKKQ